MNKKQKQIEMWEKAQRIRSINRRARPLTRDFKRAERKVLQEEKRLTKKQRKALIEGSELSKDGIETVNNFFMILNTLKITHKLADFGIDPWRRSYKSSNPQRLADFYTPKPDVPQKGNPRKEKQKHFRKR